MKTIYDCCELRPEVLQGELDDAIFAADFGHVVEGIAPKVYLDPEEFFKNTHPAAALKKVVNNVFGRLADPNESGARIRLSTGFGGGKTHTLIALWHLAKNINKLSIGTELLDAAGRPEKVVVAGVDGDKAGTEVFLQHANFQTHSLWGELAYQLGGVRGYEKVKNIDDPEKVPHAALIREILTTGAPVLILLDEIVLYMCKLSERGKNALTSFINSLISEISALRQAVLVITDTADQTAYQKETSDLEKAMETEAAAGFDDVLGRKMTDFDPIGTETAQVIIRRLFTKVDRAGADEASGEYYNAYKRICSENPGLLPRGVDSAEYAKRIVECYPFHPRLLDTARDRLGALQSFQKSRGTLRLFARILRDIWQRKPDIPLITAGDINWENSSIQADLLQRLNRDNFKAAVDADILRHAAELDKDYQTDIHRRVASALLLESLPMTANAAMDKADITLATLRPSEVGHEPGEAIDRLISVCWHTYKIDSGEKFQFRYEPNANKIIEEAVARISTEDALARVRTRVIDYFKGATFDLKAYPQRPSDVPDSNKLKLVLCDSEELAQAVCDFEDDSDPESKRPRRFRNAILAIAPNQAGLDEAVRTAKWELAAEAVLHDYKDNKELKAQVEEIIVQLRKRAQIAAYRAFNRVFFQGRQPVSLAEKYLVQSESALGTPSGQANLKKFLDDEGLIYQYEDSLDVDLLINDIIPGSTPSLDHQGAYPASAIHERALASIKLRLMIDGSPVRNAIIKAVESGKLVVRLANGDVYDSKGKVTGPEGERRRIDGDRMYTMNLTSDVLVAPPDAPCVSEWTAISETSEINGNGNGDEKLGTVNADTWHEAINLAQNRPMLSLKLEAQSPDTARTLARLAQPFSANSVLMTVLVNGELKEGGSALYKVENVKLNTNLRPIDEAAKLYRAMNEDAEFTVEIAMNFGDSGRTDVVASLEQARDTAPEDVKLSAKFGKEIE